MVTVILSNYDTREELKKFNFNPPRGCKNEMEEALKYVETWQQTEDILRLGKPCKIKRDGFGLGIQNITTNGCYQSTICDTRFSTSNKEPNYLCIVEGTQSEQTNLRIEARLYKCGLVINTGREVTCGLFSSRTEPAYFKKLTAKKLSYGTKNTAKLFDSPLDVKNYILKKKDVFENMVTQHGFELSVEYVTDEYKADMDAAFSENQKLNKRWNAQMKELEQLLDELNSTESETIYATEKTKELAEWELNGCEGERPTPLTEEDLIAEAALRMKILNIDSSIIENFKTSGKLFMNKTSLNSPAVFELDQNAAEAVRKAKEESGLYPYLVIRTDSEMLGEITDVLYVSKSPGEWQIERPNADGYVMSYCISDAQHGEAEFGNIRVKAIGIGVKRIA